MKKGLKITLIAVISVLVVLGAGFAIVFATQGDYVKNSWAMLTKDEKEYYNWVAEKNLDKGLELAKTKMAENEALSSSEYTLDSALTLEAGNSLLALFAPGSIRDVKPVKLYSTVASDEKNSGLLMGIGYNDENIFSVAFGSSLANKELYLSFPEYKRDAIDLSELMSFDLTPFSEVEGFTEFNDMLKGMGVDFQFTDESFKDPASFISSLKDYMGSIQDKNKELFIPDEDADYRSQILEYLGKVEAVELEKDEIIRVNGIEAECNTLEFDITKEQILEELSASLSEKAPAYKEKILDSLSGIQGSEDFDKQFDSAIDEVEKSIDKLKNDKETNFGANVTLYVNKKGEIIGACIKVTYNSYKVKLDFINSDSKEDAEAGIAKTGAEISVNGTTLLKVTVTHSEEDEYNVCNVKAVPGSMITSLIGEDKKFELEINCRTRREGSESESDVELTVLMNGEKFGTIGLSEKYTGGKANFPIDKSSTRLIKASELFDTDYVDTREALNVAVKKVDSLTANDPTMKSLFDMATEGGTLSWEGFKKRIEDNGDEIDALNEKLKESLKTLTDSLVTAIKNNDLSSFSSKEASQIFTSAIYGTKYDLDAPLSAFYPELKDCIVPFDYKDLAIDTYYVEIPNQMDYVEPFLATCSPVQLLSADTSRTVSMNDRILFDAVPLMAGFEVSAYAYKAVPTTIGKYEYGDGIDDLLLGMHAGESKKLELTLDDRFGDFAGYSGTFKITVSGIYDEIKPEWSENYIVRGLGYASLQDCLNELCPDTSAKFIDKSRDEIMSDLQTFVFNNLIDIAKLQNAYDTYAETIEAMFDSQYNVMSAGENPTYRGFLIDRMGLSEAEADDYVRQMVINNMATFALDAYMAEKENIVYSYREYFDAAYPGATDDEMLKALADTDDAVIAFAIESEISDKVWEILYNVVVTK